MRAVINVDKVGKLYRLGKIGTGTLSHDLKRWWAEARGKEDPYAKIGSVNDRTQQSKDGEYVWALRDISFSVSAGDVVGIIGKNGAGKSTLLKILSRITTPTNGSVKVKGRIGSLLEVGTGFHLEMTGRENIYMNGTILGMRRSEITRKFDEIVEFAGVAKYIDTPVKRYSSGMTVRLGFAVAAFLEPEILVVDEVLAVGDAEFQKRAIGKMQEVSRSGRTVLFVSHNMRAVKRLCQRGVVLSNGGVVFDGEIEAAVNFYLNGNGTDRGHDSPVLEWTENNAPGNSDVRLVKAVISRNDDNATTTFLTSEIVTLSVILKLSTPTKNLRVNVHLVDEEENIIFAATSQNLLPTYMEAGLHQVTVKIPSNLLNERTYTIRLSAGIQGVQNIISPFPLFSFTMSFADNESTPTHFVGRWPGVVAPALEWNVTLLNQ